MAPRRAASLVHRCFALWESLQVELHGQFTIARLEELHQYNDEHTLAHVVGVTLLTPLPCLVVIALVECIPLRPVQDGLAHCGNFWIRNIITLFLATSCFIEQVRFCIRHIPIRGAVVHGISLLGSIATVYTSIGIAHVIGFPLPFAIPLAMPPWMVLVGFPLWLSLRRTFRQHPDASRLVTKYSVIILCQLSLILVYSLYAAGFANLVAHWQLLFSLALPLIKLVEKNLFARLLLHDAQDLKPEIVVFNVEVFNALFTAICMQQATSIHTSLALIVVDFVQACIALRDLDVRLTELQTITNRLGPDQHDHIRNVFAIIISDPEFVHEQNVRTNSVPTGIGAAIATAAARGAVAPDADLLRLAQPTTAHTGPMHGPSKNQVAPASLAVASPRLDARDTHRASVLVAKLTRPERHMLGQKVLAIIYLAEFLLLIEFVEVMIPLVYCTSRTACPCDRSLLRSYSQAWTDRRLHAQACTCTSSFTCQTARSTPRSARWTKRRSCARQ